MEQNHDQILHTAAEQQTYNVPSISTADALENGRVFDAIAERLETRLTGEAADDEDLVLRDPAAAMRLQQMKMRAVALRRYANQILTLYSNEAVAEAIKK